MNCFTIYPLDKEVEAVSSEKKQLQPNKFSFSKKKKRKKMTNSLSKEMKLKLSIEDFREQDVPEIIINLSTYNCVTEHHPCYASETYDGFCERIMKEKWRSEWRDFNYVIEKIKKCEKNFIDISNFSNNTRY